MTRKSTKAPPPIPAGRYRASSMITGALLKDETDPVDGIMGSFATLAGAQAMADILNAIDAMPFASIGTTLDRDGCSHPDSDFGRERVAHFVAKSLGCQIKHKE